jgi:hypothetical protein
LLKKLDRKRSQALENDAKLDYNKSTLTKASPRRPTFGAALFVLTLVAKF